MCSLREQVRDGRPLWGIQPHRLGQQGPFQEPAPLHWIQFEWCREDSTMPDAGARPHSRPTWAPTKP
eukprot:12511444-Alexandrium_andersonii.AAC.1